MSGLDWDKLPEVLAEHKPILNVSKSFAPMGCQCMDRVFYRSESHADHLAAVVRAWVEGQQRVLTEPGQIESEDIADGTVILDGQGEAWQKSGGEWYLAAGGYMDSGPADYLPARVIHEGDKP